MFVEFICWWLFNTEYKVCIPLNSTQGSLWPDPRQFCHFFSYTWDSAPVNPCSSLTNPALLLLTPTPGSMLFPWHIIFSNSNPLLKPQSYSCFSIKTSLIPSGKLRPFFPSFLQHSVPITIKAIIIFSCTCVLSKSISLPMHHKFLKGMGGVPPHHIIPRVSHSSLAHKQP